MCAPCCSSIVVMTLSIRLFLSVQDKSGRLQQTPTHGISQYWAVDGY
jgi:hypothetical protein